MSENKVLDFDATSNSKDGDRPVRDFVRNFFEHARDKAQQKNEEFSRINKMYHAEMSMANRDPNMSNIFIPKLYSTVETIVPHYVDAILGMRPYIPIELSDKRNIEVGDAMTELLDSYLATKQFYLEFVKFIKIVTLFGTAFIEARPDYEDRLVKTLIPVESYDISGMPVNMGMATSEEMRRFLRLTFRTFAPWEIYQDPFAKDVEDCRGLIKFRGYASKRQIKKMAERGAFGDFDIDKLEKAEGDTSVSMPDNWSQKMAQDLGHTLPKTDDDMGIWLSFESADRYIDLWNFETLLRDVPNPYDKKYGGHGGVNLTKAINVLTPNPHTSWYGIGEGKPIERLCHSINKHWNQTFNNHDMQNEGVIYYAEDAFNVDQLVMIGGNRIPAEIGPGQSIADVLYERPTPGLPRDFYAIPEVLDRITDETTGVHEITRGETSSKNQTAREAILKRSASDSRIKLKIKLGEYLGLGDFGLKCLAHLEQFGTIDDYADRIGMDRAGLLTTVNPANMEGGHRFDFKGSNRMADSQIKRQDAKDILQLLAGNPTVNQEWLANWVLEKFEVPDSERRRAVRNDEQAMQIMAQMAAMGGTSGAESTRGISNGKTLGGAIGYTPSGRDMNEKLAAG